MSDASSIRKISSLTAPNSGAAFYKGAIRFNGTQAYVFTGTQWAPTANQVISIPFPVVADAVDQIAFVADRAYTVTSVVEVHTVAGGAASTVDVKKCTGTQAPSAGTTVLAAAVALDATANTAQTATLSATAANLALAAGDRLALDFSGTVSPIAGAIIQITLQPA